MTICTRLRPYHHTRRESHPQGSSASLYSRQIHPKVDDTYKAGWVIISLLGVYVCMDAGEPHITQPTTESISA